MGPPGLWSELRRQGAASSLQGREVEQLLKGKALAVDGAVWLYEAQTQPEVLQAYGAERAVLKVVFERCVRWLRKGVLPVVVLEGSGGGRGQRIFSWGRGGLGSTFAPQSQLRGLLTALGVPCINAVGEAEAACAALAMAGVCDFVATTDFDALLFGAPKVLRDLKLMAGRSTSSCELWDAATIERVSGLDRRALVAAAFLVGCDYDCRSQTSSQDAKGLRGIGPRQALVAAQALRGDGDGDALSALGELLNSSSQSDPSQCAMSQYVASQVSQASGTSACRLLNRIANCAAAQPRCVDGFLASIRQYERVVRGACEARAANTQDLGPFVWRGVDVIAAETYLMQIYPGKFCDKLEPLHLEWALRVVAAECPLGLRGIERFRWAERRGLRYAPLSAKRPPRRTSNSTSYVLVDFARTQEGPHPARLPADKRHARLSLAQACGLLAGEVNTKASRGRSSLARNRRLSFFFPRRSRIGNLTAADGSEHVRTEEKEGGAAASPQKIEQRRVSVRSAPMRQLRLSLYAKGSKRSHRSHPQPCSVSPMGELPPPATPHKVHGPPARMGTPPRLARLDRWSAAGSLREIEGSSQRNRSSEVLGLRKSGMRRDTLHAKGSKRSRKSHLQPFSVGPPAELPLPATPQKLLGQPDRTGTSPRLARLNGRSADGSLREIEVLPQWSRSSEICEVQTQLTRLPQGDRREQSSRTQSRSRSRSLGGFCPEDAVISADVSDIADGSPTPCRRRQSLGGFCMDASRPFSRKSSADARQPASWRNDSSSDDDIPLAMLVRV